MPMTATRSKQPLWWDREIDSAGNPLRADVRSSAHQLWDQACKRVHTVLGDPGEAAGLMEKSVAQVSRYLDRIDCTSCERDATGLLMSAFSRALRRYAIKLRRLEFVDNVSEVMKALPARKCASKEDCRLDAEKAARNLSPRGRRMHELRLVGFEWKEIAEVLKTTPDAARAEFSREVKRAKLKMERARRLGTPPSSGCH
jgi:hypothetical protein